MADRFFPNEMPESAAEAEETSARSSGDPLIKLLSFPYETLSLRFKRAALDVKDAVVRETWALGGKRVQDYTLYTGALGTAFLLFKAYQITNNRDNLNLCSEIVKACDSASSTSGYLFSPSFRYMRVCASRVVVVAMINLNRWNFTLDSANFLLAPLILYWIQRISWEQRSWCERDRPRGIFLAVISFLTMLKHLNVLIKRWHIDLNGER